MSYIEKIKDDLETLKEIILEKVPTDQIWLFSSYAYGTPNRNSDVDSGNSRTTMQVDNATEN